MLKTPYTCPCGKVFTTSQQKYSHKHYCKLKKDTETTIELKNENAMLKKENELLREVAELKTRVLVLETKIQKYADVMEFIKTHC
jgi:hypothetical protein